MALQKQFFRLNFGQGIDTKSDPKALQSGKMTVLQNCQFVSANRINKRNGFSAVGPANSSGDLITNMDSFKGVPFGIGMPATTSTTHVMSLWQYNASLATPAYTPYSPIFTDCQCTSFPVVQNNNAQANGDVGYTNGYTCYAWTEIPNGSVSSLAYYKIVQTSNGNTVVPNTQISSLTGCRNIRVTTLANSFLIAFRDQANSQLSGVALDSANHFTSTSFTFSGFNFVGGRFAGLWDWTSFNTGSTSTAAAFVAYQTSSTVIDFLKINYQGTQLASASYTVSATVSNLGMMQPYSSSSTTYRALVVDIGNAVHHVPFNTSLTLQTASTAAVTTGQGVLNITGQELSTQTGGPIFLTLYADAATVLSANGSISVTMGNMQLANVSQYNISGTTITALTSPGQTMRSLMATSKPYYYDDNNIYLWTRFESALQAQQIMIRWSSYLLSNTTTALSSVFTPTARILAGEAYSLHSGGTSSLTYAQPFYGYGSLANHIPASGSQTQTIALLDNYSVVNAVGGGSSYWSYQVPSLGAIVSDFSTSNKYASAELNGQKLIAGGFNALFDGVRVTELGFFYYPEGMTCSASSVTGLLGIGLYQYCACYAWTDNAGNLHRSIPSVPVSITNTVGGNTTIVVNTLRATLKNSVTNNAADAVVELYRSTVTPSAPVVFYLVNQSPISSNTTTADTVIIIDQTPDALLQTQQLLYTTGGIEDNYTVDGTSVLCAGPDRPFASIPTSNGVVAIGLPYVQTNGLAFIPGITQLIPVKSSDGPITAMAMLDNTLVVFYLRSIWACQGLGPTANGQNNQLTPFQLITDQVGCAGPKQLTLYPEGIMFWSAKGCYRLGHDLSFAPDSNYIGGDVETYNADSCLRASSRNDMNQVRFLMSDNQTILCYDYYFNQWSTIMTKFTDMVNIGPSVYMASSTPSVGALVAQEAVGTFTDALLSPTGIPFLMTTGWLALNQLQGAQRIYRVRFLGDFKSTHSVTVQIAYDYETSGGSPYFNETHTLTSANILASSAQSAYQFEVFPLRQKCQAIMLQISDGTPTGESFDLTDIEVEVGLIPGRRFPLAATKGG